MDIIADWKNHQRLQEIYEDRSKVESKPPRPLPGTGSVPTVEARNDRRSKMKLGQHHVLLIIITLLEVGTRVKL